MDKKVPTWYHISTKYLGKKATLSPRVPTYCNINEEGNIPRICVANNIQNCLYGVIGVDNIRGADIFDTFHTTLKNRQEIQNRIRQLKKLAFVKSISCLKSLSFDGNYDVIVYCHHLPTTEEQNIILNELGDVVGKVNFFPNKKGQFDKFLFVCVKNPAVYITKEKAYLPPNASDFRQNNEHWLLKPTEFKFLGRLNIERLLFTLGGTIAITNKKFSCYPEAFLKSGINL